MGYNRPGTSDFTGAIANNPASRSRPIATTRSATWARQDRSSSAIARTSARRRTCRRRASTRCPTCHRRRHCLRAGLQVPYGMTWTGGWQRKVGSSMVVEARYVGTRSLQSWQTYNYNEINIVENGFLNEFRLAQQNLRGQHRRGPRQHVPLHRRGRALRRCRSSWRTSAAAGVRRGQPRQLPAPTPTGRTTRSSDYLAKFNPDAVQLRQHRQRSPDRKRHVPQQRAHGRICLRTSSRPTRI